MAFPARCLFTILEVSARWICSQTQIVDWAISDEIDLVAAFREVRFDDQSAAGLLSVPGSEVRPLFRPFGEAAKKIYVKQARRPGSSVWLTITDPVRGIRFAAELGKDLDPFDLICHIAFDAKPLTRRERADSVKKRDVFTKYGPQAKAVLEALLDKYADEGVMNLDDLGVLKIAPFSGMGSVVELVRAFGGKPGFEQAVHDLQSAIYEESA